MQPDKATGPENIIVTEMLKEFPIETIYEMMKWVQRSAAERASLHRRGTLSNWCSYGGQIRQPTTRIRGHLAIALISVLAKFFLSGQSGRHDSF